MKIQCSSCRMAFNVPDDKIPPGRKVSTLCPKCRAPIELSREEPPPGVMEFDAPEEEERDDYDFPSEMMDDGIESLLLCVSGEAIRGKLEKSLRGNYHLNPVPTAKAALSELRHNRYDMVIIEEAFDGSNRETNPVLRYIQPLPMQMRRQLFVCLVSETLSTSDNMAAFRTGVNFILNAKDLDKTKLIVDRAVKEHRFFYKVFRDELEAKGRV